MIPCTASFVLLLLAPSAAPRQEAAKPAEAAKPSQEAQKTPQEGAPATPTSSFPAEQLEQLVAPIALYPDKLLAQILMASTYPLEIVEAARWLQKNPKLEGEKLEAALKDQTWDPAVKSLCGFADVVKRMSDNLDWTQDLGDAFLGQKAEVMAAVQTMRQKAYESGNLKSSKELTVTEQADKVIVIEAADPEVIYVPTYYPTVVYGGWTYPYWHYPPMYPYPPAGGAWFGFTAGVIWGAAIWGDCDWGHSDVDIDIENHNTFVDRTENSDRRQEVKDRAGTSDRARTSNRAATGDRAGNKAGWKHDSSHRKGVGYKNDSVAQRYGGGPGQTRVSRDQARGYGDRSGASPSTRATGDRATASARSTSASSRAQASTRSSAASSSRSTGQRSSSFSGSRSPSMDRAGSSRGASSRGSLGSRGGGGRGGRR